MSGNKLAGVIVACTIAIVLTIIVVAGSAGSLGTPSCGSAQIGAPRPADIRVSNLRVHPDEAHTGEQMTISVLARNHGELVGDYQVTFKIDGTPVGVINVHLAGGDAERVEFTTAADYGPGEHSLDVNGLLGSFSVRAKSEPVPVNITLEHFGVKCAHGGNVELIVVVGDEENMQKYLFPPGQETYSTGDYETKRIEHRIFHTTSAAGNLKMSVLAYHRDRWQADTLALIKMMEWYYGDSINMLKQLVLSMPSNDVLIGYYERVWSQDELRGITQHQKYEEVGIDDLRLWFSVWPSKEPPSPTERSLFPEKLKVFVDGYPLWHTGTLSFERELQRGDTIGISMRQIPPYDNQMWRNWGMYVSDPQGKRVSSLTEKTSISGSVTYTADSGGIHTITIWNSGYGFNAEVEFDPIEWRHIRSTHASRVKYCD